MIALVVCYRNEGLLKQLRQSFGATIGIDGEFIPIDNRDGKFGICDAYNLGAALASCPIIGFVHEDVIFHTPNWGQKVMQHFRDPKVGALGVAGTEYFGKKWFSWSIAGQINLIQHHPDGRVEQPKAPESEPREAVALDGVLIFARKSVVEEHPFDEKTFPHFHCYDIDFSLRVAQTHRVLVIGDVLIEHLSAGHYASTAFFSQYEKFLAKWQEKLPFCKSALSTAAQQRLEWRLFVLYVRYKLPLTSTRQLWQESRLLAQAYPNRREQLKAWINIFRHHPRLLWQRW